MGTVQPTPQERRLAHSAATALAQVALRPTVDRLKVPGRAPDDVVYVEPVENTVACLAQRLDTHVYEGLVLERFGVYGPRLELGHDTRAARRCALSAAGEEGVTVASRRDERDGHGLELGALKGWPQSRSISKMVILSAGKVWLISPRALSYWSVPPVIAALSPPAGTLLRSNSDRAVIRPPARRKVPKDW
jgi:hypothetical protein